MIFSLNAGSARLQSSNSISVYDEISEIFKKVLLEIQNGGYEIVIKNTPMTFATPKITVTATVTNPTITVGNTINLNGTNIILGTSGTNLNCIIADINDSNITGVLAYKVDNKLVLEYTPLETSWQLVIGGGTANTELGLTADIYTASNPLSVTYFGVWTETVENRKLKNEMDMIINYFENLGYVIYRKTNINTSNTFEWVVQW